jgi:hypothetical protein
VLCDCHGTGALLHRSDASPSNLRRRALRVPPSSALQVLSHYVLPSKLETSLALFALVVQRSPSEKPMVHAIQLPEGEAEKLNSEIAKRVGDLAQTEGASIVDPSPNPKSLDDGDSDIITIGIGLNRMSDLKIDAELTRTGSSTKLRGKSSRSLRRDKKAGRTESFKPSRSKKKEASDLVDPSDLAKSPLERKGTWDTMVHLPPLASPPVLQQSSTSWTHSSVPWLPAISELTQTLHAPQDLNMFSEEEGSGEAATESKQTGPAEDGTPFTLNTHSVWKEEDGMEDELYHNISEMKFASISMDNLLIDDVGGGDADKGDDGGEADDDIEVFGFGDQASSDEDAESPPTDTGEDQAPPVPERSSRAAIEEDAPKEMSKVPFKLPSKVVEGTSEPIYEEPRAFYRGSAKGILWNVVRGVAQDGPNHTPAYYHPGIDMTRAEEIVGAPDVCQGAFLVRDSSQPGDMTLSFRNGRRVMHSRIVCKETWLKDALVAQYTLQVCADLKVLDKFGNRGGPWFKSVTAVCDGFRKRPIPQITRVSRDAKVHGRVVYLTRPLTPAKVAKSKTARALSLSNLPRLRTQSKSKVASRPALGVAPDLWQAAAAQGSAVVAIGKGSDYRGAPGPSDGRPETVYADAVPVAVEDKVRLSAEGVPYSVPLLPSTVVESDYAAPPQLSTVVVHDYAAPPQIQLESAQIQTDSSEYGMPVLPTTVAVSDSAAPPRIQQGASQIQIDSSDNLYDVGSAVLRPPPSDPPADESSLTATTDVGSPLVGSEEGEVTVYGFEGESSDEDM